MKMQGGSKLVMGLQEVGIHVYWCNEKRGKKKKKKKKCYVAIQYDFTYSHTHRHIALPTPDEGPL